LDATGFPITCLRDAKEVAQIRQMAQEKMQRQEQIEALPKIAKAASLAGKETHPSSPLKMLLGGAAEPGEPK
jgi:hypothetical protein